MDRKTKFFATAVAFAAAMLFGGPAPAAAEESTLFACTESQKTEIRQVIRNDCGGSGTARVYCSWTGLWEIRGIDCAAT